MSKKSRKRNKLILAGAALFGASKMGLLGGKTDASKMITSGGGGKDTSKMVTKAKPIIKEIAKPTNKGPGIYSEKDVLQSGPFKMFGVNTGNKFSADSIAKFKAANAKAAEKKGTMSLKDTFNKLIAGKKTQLKAKGGMSKLYKGGMAVSGKGQGIVLAGKNKKTIIC